MFGIDWQELLVIVFIAVVVIGPKDLPRAMRTAGKWLGKIRRTSNHFRSGIEAMIREAELEEMEKKWAEQNAQIMAQVPQVDLSDHEMKPLPAADRGPTAESRVAEAPQPVAEEPPADPPATDEPQLPLR
ncbi:Sec-independent protein translocase protein TatB [Tsuneonella dongtanensis]|uniref:Sec-independent protein translocase protein TatB n=1 Tax=Tsuneonella dongtanensis TaxID=692370 RepID=A0A1B2AGQ6_9SPHN|nr:Sec-independent protein translocase protein TatB [Tsuneonella dongtanensis]ANY21301.1 Sec-independent protein translocase protein TatB [Tsuneonella dongtanensis]